MNGLQVKYNDALKNLPAPGSGAHCAILGVSNRGVLAGIPPQQIFDDIRQSIPPGKRGIPDKEIQEAINKAMADINGGAFTARPRPAPLVREGEKTLQRIIAQGQITTEADLWEASPIRLLEEPQGDPALFLEVVFKPDDLIWIGERYDHGIIGDTIRTAAEWINYFRNGGKTGPFIIINPVSGNPATTKTGKITLRGDENVVAYRYCPVEFDTLSRQDQIRFWSAAQLPIIALIDSGGKSIHAWLEVSQLAKVEDSGQWEAEIKSRFYDCLLTPLGVDKACSNPARLSRLPGHYRTEKKQYQKLLWLSPKGRSVC